MLRQFETLLLATTKEQLLDNLRRTVHGLGFESFVYGGSPAGRVRGEAQTFDATDFSAGNILSDYPLAWTSHYIAAGYLEVDPLIAQCSRSMVPAIWHRQAWPQDARTADFFDEARQHGIGSGMTCSVIGGGGVLGLLSLTRERTRQRDLRVVEQQAAQGHMLMSYLHESMRRLDAQAQPAAVSPPAVRLTAREKEVLTWVGAGKTSWEIARILALAERTVIFHVDNAMKKLDTRTRSQAVAKAFALGLIAP